MLSIRPSVPVKIYASAMLIFMVLAILATYPAFLHLDNSAISGIGRGELSCWLNEDHWFTAALNCRSLADLDRQFQKAGDRLAYFNFADHLIDIPFRLVCPFPRHFNLTVLTILILNSFCGFLLIHYLTGNYSLSLLSGAVLGFNPITFREIEQGHFEFACLGFLYLFVLFLYRMKDESRLSNIVWAALMFLLNCLLYWFFGFGAFLVLLLFVLCNYLTVPPSARRSFVMRLLWLLLLLDMALVPIIMRSMPAIAQQTSAHRLVWFEDFPSHDALFKVDGQAEGHGALRIFMQQMIFGESHGFDFVWKRYNWLLLLTFLPLIIRRRAPVFMILSLLIFYILNLGPYLKWEDLGIITWHGSAIDLPYKIFYKYVPFFSRLRYPDRLEVFVLLFLVMPAASNLHWLYGFARGRTSKFVFHSLMIGVLLPAFFCGQIPYPLIRFDRYYPFASTITLTERGKANLLALPVLKMDTPGASSAPDPFWREYCYVLLTWKSRELNDIVLLRPSGDALAYYCSLAPEEGAKDIEGRSFSFEELKNYDFFLLQKSVSPESYICRKESRRELQRALERENRDFRKLFGALRRTLGPPVFYSPDSALFRIGASGRQGGRKPGGARRTSRVLGE